MLQIRQLRSVCWEAYAFKWLFTEVTVVKGDSLLDYYT